MKKWLIALLLLASPAWAARDRTINIAQLGYSVTQHMFEGDNMTVGDRPFHTVTDTMEVRAGQFTAGISLDYLNLNGYPGIGVYQQGHTGSTSLIPIEISGLDPYYQTSVTNNWLFYYQGTSNAILRLFNSANQTDYATGSYPTDWHLFQQHQRPYTAATPTSLTWQKYDIVMIKPPYRQWIKNYYGQFTSTDSANYLQNIRNFRDSVAAHPEMNVVLIFGTPLTYDYGTTGITGITVGHEDDFGSDTIAAKRVYGLPQPSVQSSSLVTNRVVHTRTFRRLSSISPYAKPIRSITATVSTTPTGLAGQASRTLRVLATS